MKLTFAELRRNPGKILEALERGEEVILSRRGEDVARFLPMETEKKPPPPMSEHPAFGMWSDHPGFADPTEAVRKMRTSRYRDF